MVPFRIDFEEHDLSVSVEVLTTINDSMKDISFYKIIWMRV
jgi:hypothetical protein